MKPKDNQNIEVNIIPQQEKKKEVANLKVSDEAEYGSKIPESLNEELTEILAKNPKKFIGCGG